MADFGPLADLLTTDDLTDLLVNGHEELWVVRAGQPAASAPSPFESEAQLGRLAQGLIAAGGRHLDQANPFADVSVVGPTGTYRVHAALASGCNPATHLSIRVHGGRHFSIEQLRANGMLTELHASMIHSMLKRRESFLISGATGSGKTTLLRAILGECHGDRIIALEDVAEIELQNAHYISLQTRQANIEGRGEITLDRLVRESLRMKPDRLVVGEVRGVELLSMLQALNTGHTGAGATIHANSVEDIPTRLTAIAMAAGVSEQSVLQQASSAFTWLIHADGHCVISIRKLNDVLS